MADKTTTLTVTPRTPDGSRSTRRLRRQGLVPGVLYGGDGEPLPFAVDARELRHALHAVGAVLDVEIDGESTPAVLKDTQRHPLRGETTHVDFLRVDLKKPIQAIVAIELLGGEDAPGIKEGGILDQPTREVNVEALPTDIPESIQIDVSQLSIGDSVTLAVASVPSGVTLLDHEEAVVASMLAPRLQSEIDELDAIEEETGVVGEAEGAAPEADGEESGDDAGDE